MWSKWLLCYRCWKAIKTGIWVQYSSQTCQYYILEIKKKLCVCYLFRLQLGLIYVESWSELVSERIKYVEIGSCNRESGNTLAKGRPVYSCYCYRRDELIWYLAPFNDEGLCSMNWKAAWGHVLLQLDFSSTHSPDVSWLVLNIFHVKDGFYI